MLNRLFLSLVIMSTLICSGCIITGRIVDNNGVGLAGVTVNLSGHQSKTAITNSDGKYRFGDLLKDDIITEGSYTVTPSASGYIFTPASRSVTITSQTPGESGSGPQPTVGVDFEASPTNSAQLKLKCYSFAMSPATTSTGDRIGFTTYDGSDEEPLHDGGAINNEILPVILGESSYVADYMIHSHIGGYEYGAVNLDVPNTDADNNGFPDFLEIEKDVNIPFSMATSPDWNYYLDYTNITFSGTMTRSAYSSVGSYSGTANKSTESFTFTGAWRVAHSVWNITYPITDANTIIIKNSPDAEGIAATTTYTSNGLDQIILEDFDLETGDEVEDIEFFSSVLNRDGTFFRGDVQVLDGIPITSWRDYANWHIEIEDNNDWDGDGFPDLTDPLIPISD